MSLLKAGDKAPHFEANDQDGKEIKLSDFKGKRLILYFYPKDMTPGCTVQANDLNDHLDELISAGYEVVGVSADSAKRHCKFIEKHGLRFRLIPDEQLKVIKAYGVWGKKKFMGKEYEGILRTTYIIDEEGRIASVIEKVKTKEHSAQILALEEA